MRLVRCPNFKLTRCWLSSPYLVIPIGLCAHLMAPTYAIAEKGADIILSTASFVTSDAVLTGAASITTIWSLALVGVATIVVSLFYA